MPRKSEFGSFTLGPLDEPRPGRPLKAKDLAPRLPLYSHPARARTQVFDRASSKSTNPDQLKRYLKLLAQCQISCEDIVANGQFLDQDRTKRRQIVTKEADGVGEDEHVHTIQPGVANRSADSIRRRHDV